MTRAKGPPMLHPGLGSSLDPLASWQVDTQEIDDVVGLYDRNLSDAGDPDRLARRLGVLWKKLATAPRLARLLVDYVNLHPRAAESPNEAGGLDAPLLVGPAFSTSGRPSSRLAAPPRPVFIEDDPMYDRWIDG